MRVVDYICRFLEKKTDSIFLISGGGCMHMVDAIGRSNLKSYCCHHEQACSLNAEGYARIKNDVGVCSVTTGPGGTNAITGVAAAWVDCIPMMVFSGQVREEVRLTEEDKRKGLRQLGPQEINIIDIVKPVTKYSVMITDKSKIKYELEKAYYIAKSGQQGPVWIDVPLDIQRDEIDEEELEGFTPPLEINREIPYDKIIGALNKAEKPLMLIGHGIRLANGIEELYKFIERYKINVVSAMSGTDLVNYDYPYYLGDQGITGNETANKAIDECDLLLIVGTRMQIRQTSWDYKNFAKNAVKIMVDISEAELEKKTLNLDFPIQVDAKDFLRELNGRDDIKINRWDIPVKEIEPFESEDGYVDVYRFLKELGGKCDFPVITSNGMVAETPHQALKLKKGQRLITNTAFGEMGKGLPMAIGACAANNNRPVICLEGDGSIMMNIQELQTMKYNNLPLKIFLFNNGVYYSIRNTMGNYFGKVFAADHDSGVSVPNWENFIKGWGINYESIKNEYDLNKIDDILNSPDAVFCEVFINPKQKMIPRWSAKKDEIDKKENEGYCKKILEKAKSKINAFVMDQDGTLKGGEDPEFIKANVPELLQKIARKRKYPVVITASGASALRTFSQLKEFYEKENIDIPIFVSIGNGTALYRFDKNGRTEIYNNKINLEDTKLIIDVWKDVYSFFGIKESDLNIKALETFKSFMKTDWEDYIPEKYVELFSSYGGLCFTEEIKTTFVFPECDELKQRELVERMQIKLNEKFGGDKYLAIRGDEKFMHIVRKIDIDTKLFALKIIMAILDLSKEEIASFGDMPLDNDKGILVDGKLDFAFTNSNFKKDNLEKPPFILPGSSESAVGSVHKAIDYLLD